MYEITKIPASEVLIVNVPSKSVETPFEVPLTRTVAPGRGLPSSASVTVPVRIFCE